MLTFEQADGSDKPYTKLQATRLIKLISRNGSVRPTKHSRQRMQERDISMQDILHAFSTGKVIADPELDIKTNRWKYNITGNGIDIKNITVATDIHEQENYLAIITVFQEGER